MNRRIGSNSYNCAIAGRCALPEHLQVPVVHPGSLPAHSQHKGEWVYAAQQCMRRMTKSVCRSPVLRFIHQHALELLITLDLFSGISVSRFNYCLHSSTTLAEWKAADLMLFPSPLAYWTVSLISSPNLQHMGSGSAGPSCVQNSHREAGKHLLRVKLHSTVVQMNCQRSTLSTSEACCVAPGPIQCNLPNVRWSSLTRTIHEKDIMCIQWKYMCSSLPRILQPYFYCFVPCAQILQGDKPFRVERFLCLLLWREMANSMLFRNMFSEQNHMC